MPVDRPFELTRVTGISASSRLPEHIRARQRKQLLTRLRSVGFEAEIASVEVSAADPGSFVFICAQGEHSLAGFSSLGKRGKPAEKVADEAVDDLFRFLDSGTAFDPHLADQILLYLAQLPGVHQFTTSTITKHLLSNARVIERFLPVRFEVAGSLNEPGLVIKQDHVV
jgi:RNA 3'-terminal phosphate cyclase (ATP)